MPEPEPEPEPPRLLPLPELKYSLSHSSGFQQLAAQNAAPRLHLEELCCGLRVDVRLGRHFYCACITRIADQRITVQDQWSRGEYAYAYADVEWKACAHTGYTVVKEYSPGSLRYKSTAASS